VIPHAFSGLQQRFHDRINSHLEEEAPKVVAEILGHTSTTITIEVYQHLMPGMSEAAGERLTSLLSNAG
jgi:integrase